MLRLRLPHPIIDNSMRIPIIFFFIVMLFGCGYKGSLYLPTPTQSSLPDAPTPKEKTPLAASLEITSGNLP